jgi:hypothetical protein
MNASTPTPIGIALMPLIAETTGISLVPQWKLERHIGAGIQK